MEAQVTTATAAEIVGIGYEGLRSYIKRGLLGRGDIMTPMVHRDAPAPDVEKIRSTWTKFGETDLCLMRVAKVLFDAGQSFEGVKRIVSLPAVRAVFRTGEDLTNAMLIFNPADNSYVILGRNDQSHLENEKALAGPAGVYVKLDTVRKHVQDALKVATTEKRAG